MLLYDLTKTSYLDKKDSRVELKWKKSQPNGCRRDQNYEIDEDSEVEAPHVVFASTYARKLAKTSVARKLLDEDIAEEY